MSISDDILAGSHPKEDMRKALQELSMRINAAYNPVEITDLPFIAVVLKLQHDGILRTMDEDGMTVYRILLELFGTVTVLKDYRRDRDGD